MEWILVWAVVTVSPQGPVGAKLPENTKFKSEAECIQFGKAHTSRMEDWTRGLLKADWQHPVRVEFQCSPGGNPA